ncbi:uncharacterized protein BDV17DRAFT_260174 [Aspergillus undulatus]|uniref:uncharacterized protein n=1 Tax=Aspergillus undulatus TaxID=1810928 RepID=UPI003CCDE027
MNLNPNSSRWRFQASNPFVPEAPLIPLSPTPGTLLRRQMIATNASPPLTSHGAGASRLRVQAPTCGSNQAQKAKATICRL